MKKLSHLLLTASAIAFMTLTSVSSKAADIVDTASQSDQFKTLVAALKAGDLVETLKGRGPFTVFAPTDEAFAKLPAGTLDNLLQPKNKSKLVQILTYHVVPGRVMSSDLAGKVVKPETVEGKKLKIDATKGDVRVNNAKVTKADIPADNGVIHVVDHVLLPPVRAHSKPHHSHHNPHYNSHHRNYH